MDSRCVAESDTTITLLDGMIARPFGWLKPPARVVTTPPGYVTRRILELKVSLMTRTPFGGADAIQATEVGLLKRALVPVPSALPPMPAPPGPPPASDVTTPAVVTRRMCM